MRVLELGVVLAILFIFGSLLVWMIYSERKHRTAKIHIAQSFGFTPASPDPELLLKISQLYQSMRQRPPVEQSSPYKMVNVSIKKWVDYDMVLFDLIHTGGGDDSVSEVQALALISAHLNLPPFVLFPKADMPGVLTGVANKIMAWVVSNLGNPVDFPQVPAFERRYVVSSPDPEGTRRFLDEIRLQRLANTRLLGIHAGGDIFVLSRMDQNSRPLTYEILSERLQQARDVYSIFSA